MWLALAMLIPSCGYRMAGQGTRLPDPVKTVAIPIFANDTNEPDLELSVTKAVTEKFQHDGRLSVVPSAGADAALSGAITAYSLNPLAYDTENRAVQYRVRIRVKIKFEDKLGKGISLEKELDTQWDYKVGVSITGAETARQDANDEAARYLGDRLVGLILDGF